MSITVKNSYESMIMNKILRKVSIPDVQEHFIINFITLIVTTVKM